MTNNTTAEEENYIQYHNNTATMIYNIVKNNNELLKFLIELQEKGFANEVDQIIELKKEVC